MRTIVFYGDSNTFGFDPRDFSGGRYDAGTIWTDRLQAMLGDDWMVVNEGMNGRRIPGGEGGYRYIDHWIDRLSPDDIFAVMLGTNDILVSSGPDASGAQKRMDALLARITAGPERPEILLIAPPCIGAESKADPTMLRYYKESVRMNEGFARLAAKYNTLFTDSSEWNIEIAYDGVHFSEEGHRKFAERMAQFVEK